MVSNVVMDEKDRWTIYGDASVIEKAKDFFKHGDMGMGALCAVIVWMSLPERRRAKLKARYEHARINSEAGGGTVLEEFTRLRESASIQKDAQKVEDVQLLIAEELAELLDAGTTPAQQPKRKGPRPA